MSEQRYHHGDLRRALITHALRIIDAEGIDALTIRRLAREAGVSHAAPAYHFADKSAIAIAVATEGFRIFGNALASALQVPDPQERLRTIGRAYCRFAYDHPAYYRIMFGEHSGLPKPEDETFAATAVQAFETLLKVVRPLVVGPDTTETEALQRTRAAAMVAWSIVHGTVTLWQSGIWENHTSRRWDGDLEILVEHAVDFIAQRISHFATAELSGEACTPDSFHEHVDENTIRKWAPRSSGMS
jgi:AcrR family transcriptional regulator